MFLLTPARACEPRARESGLGAGKVGGLLCNRPAEEAQVSRAAPRPAPLTWQSSEAWRVSLCCQEHG